MSSVTNRGLINSAIGSKVVDLCVVLVLLIVGAGASIGVPRHGKPITVGMIPLLATPQRYNGKVVSTIGFLHIGRQPEDDSLWLHEEDGQLALYKNSFALDLSDNQRKQFANLNHTYVSIEGTLHSNGPGSTDLYCGRIGDITAMEGWHPYRPSPPTRTK